jgi:predicted transcriptional regulator
MRGMSRLLTPAELEIMSALWNLEEGTVRDVQERLGGERAVTTISTLVRILEQKGFVHSRRLGRQALYRAAVPRQAYQRASLRDLLRRVFGGDATALVRSLVSDARAGEIAGLRALLKEKKR